MFYNTGIGTFVWVVTNHKAKDRAGKIQLVDARQRFTQMRRSLGNKRRYLTDETIDDITREHGGFKPTETCKIFDNDDFGYRRITIERPLRLRFQITDEAKESFLDACPEFLDAMQAMETEIGTDPSEDWNESWESAQPIVADYDAKWTAANRKLFRQCFTTVDPEAQPVIAKHGKAGRALASDCFPRQTLKAMQDSKSLSQLFGIHAQPGGKTVEFEADPNLRDFENVPLKDHIVDYVLREVRPFVADAWIDRHAVDEQDEGIGKVGYEINFNREFFRYQPPRPLKVIDEELAAVEKRILEMLVKVTE